jgi:hypothetical protein
MSSEDFRDSSGKRGKFWKCSKGWKKSVKGERRGTGERCHGREMWEGGKG